MDINLFLGRIKISQIDIDGQGTSDLSGATLYADIAILPLLTGDFVVEDVTIEGIRLRIEEPEPGNYVIVVPLEKAAVEDEQPPEDVKIPMFAINRLQISDSTLEIAVNKARGSLLIQELSIDNLASFSADADQPEAADLKLNALWNNTEIGINGKLNAFAESPSFEGNIAVEKFSLAEIERLLPVEQSDLKLDGSFSSSIDLTASAGEAINVSLSADSDFTNLKAGKADQFSLQIGELSNSLALTFATGQESQYQVNAETTSDFASLKAGIADRLSLQIDKLNNKLVLTFAAEEENRYRANADTTIDFSNLKGGIAEQFSLQIDKLSNTLALTLSTDQETRYRATADATVEQASFSDNKRKLVLAQFDRLQLLGLEGDETTKVDIGSLQLEQLAVAAESSDSELFKAKALNLENIAYTAEKLLVKTVSANDLASRIDIGKQDEIELVQRLLDAGKDAAAAFASEQASTTEQAAPAATETDAPGELTWDIGQIAVKKMKINFNSYHYPSPLSAELLINELLATHVGNAQPRQPGTLKLDGEIGKYGQVNVSGNYSSLLDPPDLQLSGTMDAIELPMISPYMEHLLGYELVSGQYDEAFDVQLKDKHVEVKNDITLRNLQVKRAEGVKPVTELPVSLDFALNLLRDSDGTIELDLPIEGDLDDPEVNVDSIVGKAIGKALATGSTSLLKLALQPYGAILMTAEMGMKLANQIVLDPMVFAPASSDLSTEQTDYADKLATLIKGKPELELTLCGRANDADRLALIAEAQQTQAETATTEERDRETETAPESAGQITIPEEQLLALATSRQDNLKKYLVENHQVANKQLFECKPEYDPDSKFAGIVLGL